MICRNARHRGGQTGVTLIEMLVVVAIVGVMAGITYPSISAGLDSLRLTAACESAATLFTEASNYAQRRQEWVEVRVSPHQLEATGRHFRRHIDLAGFTASPELVMFVDPQGRLPGAQIELKSAKQTRRVRIDPITGLAEVERAP